MTRPQRVLRVITTIEPEVGGPSHSTLSSAAAESRTGAVATTLVHTVGASTDRHPVAPPKLGDAVESLAFPRVPWPAAVAQRWGVSPSLVWWLIRSVRSFDVVHAEYVWSVGTLVATVAAKASGVPVVLTPHESLTAFGMQTSRTRLRERQKRAVRSLLLRGVERVVFTSDLESADSGVAPSKAAVIALPIAIPPAPAPRRANEEPGKALAVGFLGRFHAKKKIRWLIEQIHEMEEDVSLVVGGGEPVEEFDLLRRWVEDLGLTARVRFVGFVRPSDRERFFSQIDVLAMPSEYECFGMVAAEAMASGRPVVVSDQTGVGPVVERSDAGYVTSVGDSGAFQAALRRLRDDPALRNRMGGNAREAARREFSADAYGRSIRKLYQEVSHR